MLFIMVKLFAILRSKTIDDGSLQASWRTKSIYIPLLIFHFSPPPPAPPLSVPVTQAILRERASAEHSVFRIASRSAQTKCLTIKRNNRWPKPKNNKWFSKANKKRSFCHRFQCGFRVLHKSEGDREEFSACHKRSCKKTLALQTTVVRPRIMSSRRVTLQRSRGWKT